MKGVPLLTASTLINFWRRPKKVKTKTMWFKEKTDEDLIKISVQALYYVTDN